jgi:conjugative transfer protein TraD
MTSLQRTAETRRTFQLGGLIVKAGLAEEEPAVLLGMLMAGARVLKATNAVESRRRWRELGARVLGLGPTP